MRHPGVPEKQGLYDPFFEHDACGVSFVVDVAGRRSHRIVRLALQALINMLHRGAVGCEANTGDGAGILLQIPHEFLDARTRAIGIELPEPGSYGVGMVCLPRDSSQQSACRQLVAEAIARTGQRLLGWRDLPTDNSPIGGTARSGEPFFSQVFIGRTSPPPPSSVAAASNTAATVGRCPPGPDAMEFERRLYLIRKRMEKAVWESDLPERGYFYVGSLSSRTIVYKGMLSADQIETYFPDLTDPLISSALALVHQRFSTNTFPSWSLAHPFRYLAHNGEINTLRGNVNWWKTREHLFDSELFGEDMKDLLPVINENGSDSAILDNVIEMLVMCGRSLPHAVMMAIPEAWDGHESMSREKRAFYEYHSCLMEPWDGPASIAFTDGRVIGAVLDRNGLRPSRYYVTRDGLVVMASEVGVLDIEPAEVLQKGRLQPGKMLLVDTEAGRIVDDAELKFRMATEHPYGEWLDQNVVDLASLPEPPHVARTDHETVLQRQQIFGYTHEDLRILMAPMAENGEEAIGSMGNDTPLAVLSERSQPLYSYFKQLFAQVTNPPLDAIREQLVTSMATALGPELNLLKPGPGSCRMVTVPTPVLHNDELARIRHINVPGFKAITLPTLFRAAEGGAGLDRAMAELCAAADRAIRNGYSIIILSDRGVDRHWAPIPSLLATSGVHHHLIREGERTQVSLIVESGDAREVHHFCLLIGYGASAINPYLAFETLDDMIAQRMLKPGIDHARAVRNYIKAANKGILKVMSKMGISTIQSYRGAQIFEAVGLNAEFVDRYFANTPSRISGVGIPEVAAEILKNHAGAFPERSARKRDLDWGGQYQWRREGEHHLFNPETVFKLQHSTRSGNYQIFKEYSGLVNTQSQRLSTLRGLFEFRFAETPIPLEEVEPADSIVKRFATGAMSFGSISKEAHETLAIAMNRLGGKSNTGEGGEDPARFVRDPNGDSRSSAIKQVASARFGVTSHYLVNARELQIKMAQGAKPGEGGQLPGHKVDENIARVRHSTPGVGLISPPPHHDIYSIEDLAQLIYDLKNSNPDARISVKLVAEVGVGTVAAGVAKAHSDVVLISGHDGGTGASPLTSIKHAGIPWELGLAETNQVLLMNDLRSRIVVQTDGQLKTGRDVVVAALLGAEEFGFATAPLVVSGCIMMRVCHLNTCPVGVATQDPELRKRFGGKPEFVENFFRFIAEEVRELMSRLGFRTVDEMVGRMDKLDVRKAIDHWKAKNIDLSSILHQPRVAENAARRRVHDQAHGLDKALDNLLIRLAQPALDRGEPVARELPIRNVHRTVGTMLGSAVTARYGADGLPDGTIRFRFTGSAGQSFGAFLPKGITLELEGDANDYLGKGLSGGRIVLFPPARSTFSAEDNIIAGNVVLYGATGGECFIRGVAGERFAVRNSGALAVVEGVGDHGCEYMTRGRAVILGHTGRNFAAGMSGGVAYVLDEEGDFAQRCNLQMVHLERIDQAGEAQELRTWIERHSTLTGSEKARRILAAWDAHLPLFVRIMPKDYKRVLEQKNRRTGERTNGRAEAQAADRLIAGSPVRLS